MKAALWTKLKCAGPLQDFESEMQRFLYWLPPPFHPLITIFRKWQRRFRQANSAAARLMLEQQAVGELLKHPINYPERDLLVDFLKRIESALKASNEARRTALEGEAIDTSLDDKLLDELLDWLKKYRHSQQREIALWLSRMMEAWRLERKGLALESHLKKRNK